jgi:hypothetical protein
VVILVPLVGNRLVRILVHIHAVGWEFINDVDKRGTSLLISQISEAGGESWMINYIFADPCPGILRALIIEYLLVLNILKAYVITRRNLLWL